MPLRALIGTSALRVSSSHRLVQGGHAWATGSPMARESRKTRCHSSNAGFKSPQLGEPDSGVPLFGLAHTVSLPHTDEIALSAASKRRRGWVFFLSCRKWSGLLGAARSERRALGNPCFLRSINARGSQDRGDFFSRYFRTSP